MVPRQLSGAMERAPSAGPPGRDRGLEAGERAQSGESHGAHPPAGRLGHDDHRPRLSGAARLGSAAKGRFANRPYHRNVSTSCVGALREAPFLRSAPMDRLSANAVTRSEERPGAACQLRVAGTRIPLAAGSMEALMPWARLEARSRCRGASMTAQREDPPQTPTPAPGHARGRRRVAVQLDAPSTKNRVRSSRERQAMLQVKKGNQWYLREVGAHRGGRGHPAQWTAATWRISRKCRGSCIADAGYAGVARRPEHRGRRIGR